MKGFQVRLVLGFLSIPVFGSALAQATLLSEHSDASGKITVGVFESVLQPGWQGFYGVSETNVIPGGDWVVMGGGFESWYAPCPEQCVTPYSAESRHLLVSSEPTWSGLLDGWRIVEKDHYYYNLRRGRAYAIGLKIQGLSRDQLRNLVAVTNAPSASVAHPDISVSIRAGHVLISGGIRVNPTNNAGNLATGLYPSSPTSWRVKSKDHILASPATAYAFAISIPAYIPGVGNIGVTTTAATSAWASLADSYAAMTPGYALTGCGVDVNYGGGQGAMV